jgi:hypothetical protein
MVILGHYLGGRSICVVSIGVSSCGSVHFPHIVRSSQTAVHTTLAADRLQQWQVNCTFI